MKRVLFIMFGLTCCISNFTFAEEENSSSEKTASAQTEPKASKNLKQEWLEAEKQAKQDPEVKAAWEALLPLLQQRRELDEKIHPLEKEAVVKLMTKIKEVQPELATVVDQRLEKFFEMQKSKNLRAERVEKVREKKLASKEKKSEKTVKEEIEETTKTAGSVKEVKPSSTSSTETESTNSHE
jgi:hypothetical protein